MAAASCERNERCLYFAFEESPDQIVRNMASIKLDLSKHVKSGMLKFYASRPSLHGLEMHLAVMHKAVKDLKPKMVIIDPISNLASVSDEHDVHLMLIRLVDFLKMHQITAVFTNLTSADMSREMTDMGISSVMDTWILVRDIEFGGERNRGIYVLKSRGSAHSNQVREFVISSKGIELLDVYTGPEGVLTGSARLAQERARKRAQLQREIESGRKQADLDRKRQALDAQIKAMQLKFEDEQQQLMRDIEIDRATEQRLDDDRAAMNLSRRGDASINKPAGPKGKK